MAQRDQLKQMIEERDRLAAELAALDRRIQKEARAYWDAKGVLAMPRPERLRAELFA